MLAVARRGYEKRVLEIKDIRAVAGAGFRAGCGFGFRAGHDSREGPKKPSKRQFFVGFWGIFSTFLRPELVSLAHSGVASSQARRVFKWLILHGLFTFLLARWKIVCNFYGAEKGKFIPPSGIGGGWGGCKGGVRAGHIPDRWDG